MGIKNISVNNAKFNNIKIVKRNAGIGSQNKEVIVLQKSELTPEEILNKKLKAMLKKTFETPLSNNYYRPRKIDEWKNHTLGLIKELKIFNDELFTDDKISIALTNVGSAHRYNSERKFHIEVWEKNKKKDFLLSFDLLTKTQYANPNRGIAQSAIVSSFENIKVVSKEEQKKRAEAKAVKPINPAKIFSKVEQKQLEDFDKKCKNLKKNKMQILPTNGRYIHANSNWDVEGNIRSFLEKEIFSEPNSIVKLTNPQYNVWRIAANDLPTFKFEVYRTHNKKETLRTATFQGVPVNPTNKFTLSHLELIGWEK